MGAYKKCFSLLLFPAVLICLVVLEPARNEGRLYAEDPSSSSSQKGPVPAQFPFDPDGRLHITEKDRCPVCAMRPAAYPKSAAAIELVDGKVFYFCGTGCMIRAWLHPEAFLDVTGQTLKRPVVTEYFSGKHIDGRAAWWVAGSDVIGPMGPALVPLESERNLEAFKKRHGHKTVFRLGDIDDKRWQEITGKKVLP